jgi:hypothetical protein
VLAAFAHIGGQLVLARAWLVPHDGVWYLLPLFATAALLFGTINGLVAARLLAAPRRKERHDHSPVSAAVGAVPRRAAAAAHFRAALHGHGQGLPQGIDLLRHLPDRRGEEVARRRKEARRTAPRWARWRTSPTGTCSSSACSKSSPRAASAFACCATGSRIPACCRAKSN